MFVNLHSIIKGSRVNGPGDRFVLWFQGCSHKCPGCYNKNIREPKRGIQFDVESLADNANNSRLDGVTISGGEPFDQPQALLSLLKLLNDHIADYPFGIIVFTGYKIKEIKNEILRRMK